MICSLVDYVKYQWSTECLVSNIPRLFQKLQYIISVELRACKSCKSFNKTKSNTCMTYFKIPRAHCTLWKIFMHYATVTFPKHTVAWWSVYNDWKTLVHWLLIDRRRHWCWPWIWSVDVFLVEAPKLKVLLTASPIFKGVCDRRIVKRRSPTIWRNWHHDIGRRSPDHRASVGRRSPDGRSMTFHQRTVGRQPLDFGRPSADDRPTFGLS